jgi:DNA replication protein DnaC
MLNEQTLTQLRACAWTAWCRAGRPRQQQRGVRTALRGAPGAAGAARDRLARRQAARPAAQGRQAQGQWRLHRGHQLARQSRGLDRHLLTALAGCDWVRHARTILITGATGTGKTWLSCALAQQAARATASRCCTPAPRGCCRSCGWRTATAASAGGWRNWPLDLLVLDDFAIAPIGAAERNDLLELLDDRVGTRSTLITSQLPVKAWHTYLDDPTLADAILDRIVHS